MRKKIVKVVKYNALILSLLLHLLLLFGSVVLLYQQPEEKKESYQYISSYTVPPSPQTTPAPKPEPEQKEAQKPVPEDKHGIEKPVPKKTVAQQSKPNVSKPPQPKKVTSEDSEPVHFLGDKKLNDPLVLLLGKAITAKLFYPRIAVDFRATGTVVVGFTVYPNGIVTNVALVKTSGVGVLDDAAVSAINHISPLGDVSAHISESKHFVFGIVFN